jgi:hypothetical protein
MPLFDEPVLISLSVTLAYEEVDLTTYGVPSGAVIAMFRIVNNSNSIATLYGIRGKGSTDDKRGRVFQQAHSQYFSAIGIGPNLDKVEIFRNQSTTAIYIEGWLPSDEAVAFLNKIDHTVAPFNAWVDADLSADIPAGAVWAIFCMDQTGVAASEINLRKKGSTDTYMRDTGSSDFQCGYMMGVDVNRVLQMYKETGTLKDANLVGYIKTGFAKTNADDISATVIGSYQNVDRSSDVDMPSNRNAVMVHVANQGSVRKLALRKNGTLQDIYKDVVRDAGVWPIPMGSEDIFQQKIEALQVDTYVLGYLAPPIAAFTRSRQARPLAIKEGFTRTGSQAARQLSTKGAFN